MTDEDWIDWQAEHGHNLTNGPDGIRPAIPEHVDPQQHGTYRTPFGATWVFPFTVEELHTLEFWMYMARRHKDVSAYQVCVQFVESMLKQLRPMYPWIMEDGMDWATENGTRFWSDWPDGPDDPQKPPPYRPPGVPAGPSGGTDPSEPSGALTEAYSGPDDVYGSYTDPDCHISGI